jgi:16S rRNA (guanine(966)-N(2))-methyltransferase RsmD
LTGFAEPVNPAIVQRNRVRIVGGAWRSRLVRFPPRRDLRPTPDRVRETVFNWLGQDLTGRACLDLFAGSGALGFEAASRGARRVVMVESDPVVYRALVESCRALGAETVEPRRADALEFLRSDVAVYDVVFLDPPFKAALWPRLAALLPARLAPGALVYYEGAAPPELPAGWEMHRQGRAGQVSYQLLRRP